MTVFAAIPVANSDGTMNSGGTSVHGRLDAAIASARKAVEDRGAEIVIYECTPIRVLRRTVVVVEDLP